MKKTAALLLAIAALFAFGAISYAADDTVGYVDDMGVLQQFSKFQQAQKQLDELGKKKSNAAKAAFDEAGLQKLPKVKELDAEFAELLTKKKAAYPDYRKARNEMQELVRAQKNVERFFAEEKPAQENEQAR